MSWLRILRSGARVLIFALVLTCVFGAGVAAGFFFYPEVFLAEEDHDPHDHDGHGEEQDADHHEHEEEGEHVALTKQACQNLGLRMGQAKREDIWKTMLVPGCVQEIPGRSNLSVSAPVTGVVETVNVLPGESLHADQVLATIRLTDEALTDAQSQLLDVLTRQDTGQLEIDRLAPLIQSGAVSGVRTRELEYEMKRLQAQQRTLVQELQGRGLPKPMVQRIVEERELASTIDITAESILKDSRPKSPANSTGYSLEDLHVHPGASVIRGEDLCSIAYHSRLHVAGTAFGDDVPKLDRIADESWLITAEITLSDTETPDVVAGLELLRVDNHVDERTQTVRFYVDLPNTSTHLREDGEGRVFEQWRFRPGQRLHLRLPEDRWENQLSVPLAAVVVDGPNAFVFAEHHHEPHEDEADHSDEREGGHTDAHDDHDDHEHDVFMELEPVPVRILYRDDRMVVIAEDGELHADDSIALNNAYKLYLAMKMQADGGGGHHHHHDH